MTRKPGIRVLAVMGSNDDGSVSVLGEGVYEGDYPIGEEAVGWVAQMARECHSEYGTESANPRIRLDSGEIVWGCECWWGPIEEVRRRLEGKTLVYVSITEERKRFAAEESDDKC